MFGFGCGELGLVGYLEIPCIVVVAFDYPCVREGLVSGELILGSKLLLRAGVDHG